MPKLTGGNSSALPWCSIIIPALNEEPALRVLLPVLRAGLSSLNGEVIVVDGGSTDGTREVATSFGSRTLLCTRGRARQMNAGATIARGRFLWFLHADTIPPADWPHLLQAAGEAPYPACFSLRFSGQEDDRVLQFLSRASHIDWDAFRFGDQSLFVATSLFFRVGGYREDLNLLEGHDLVRRLRHSAGGFTLLPAAVTTSARRYLRHGTVYTQSVFVLIFFLYYLGVKQDSLARLHRFAFRQ